MQHEGNIFFCWRENALFQFKDFKPLLHRIADLIISYDSFEAPMLTRYDINRKQVRRALKIRSIHHILWTKTKVWFLGNLRTSKRLELQIQPSHVNCGQATRHHLLPATAGRNTNWNFKRFKIRRGCLIIANTETEGTEPSSDPIVTIQRQS